MAHFIIGDIQGCFDELLSLLKKIQYNENDDELWFCGDLINRGPKSIEALEFIISCKNTKVVLGNHDIHFLAMAKANRNAFPSDTLEPLLNHPNTQTWCEWLLKQPLLHFSKDFNITMVHAGILPCWTIEQAQSYASEVETILQSDDCTPLLDALFGNEPISWSENLTGMERLRFITNVLTRMRFCVDEKTLELNCKLPVGEQPKHLRPWFDFTNFDTPIYFGHWAALGGISNTKNIHATDTGCVWGRELTAIRLEDNERFSVPAKRCYKTRK